jgi:hypothetical protein
LKEFDVSLVFLTDASIDKSQVIPVCKGTDEYLNERIIDSEKLWRVESSPDADGSIASQIKSIQSIISIETLRSHKQIKMLYFDVAVYHNSYTCSISLPSDSLNLIKAFHPEIGVELTIYPADEE